MHGMAGAGPGRGAGRGAGRGPGNETKLHGGFVPRLKPVATCPVAEWTKTLYFKRRTPGSNP